MLVRASSERGIGKCITVFLDEGYEDVQAERLMETIGSANIGPDQPPCVRCALSVTNFEKIKRLFPAARLDTSHQTTLDLVNKLKATKVEYDNESRMGDLVKRGKLNYQLLPNYKFKMKPFDHQVVAWQFLHVMTNAALFGDPGVGKSLCSDTPVLTPNGWTKIRDLSIGDLVIAGNGKPYPVTGVYPQGNLPLFRVKFNDHSSVLASADHLWKVRNHNDSNRNRPWRILATDDFKKNTYGKAQLSARWRIPIVEPIQLPVADLPLHPYLLGVLLGDRSLTGTPSWTGGDREIAKRVGEVMPAGCRINKLTTAHRAINWSIIRNRQSSPAPNRVTAALKKLGLWEHRSWEKFVPHQYLFSSIEQRLELLRGLLDTDGGTTRSTSTIEFSSSSRNLAESVLFLARSLGGRGRLSPKKTPTFMYKGEKKEGRPSHRVHLALPPHIKPFHLERKLNPRILNIVRTIRSITPEGTGDATCISIDSPDNTFVVNDFVVTHNTYISATWADSLIKTGHRIVMLVICPVTIIKHAWLADVAKFTDLTVTRLHEPSSYKRKEKREARFAENSDVYIINPELLIRVEKDVNKLLKRHIKDGKDFLLVVDESSKLKSRTSASYKATRRIRQLANKTVILTGTPASNGIGDLWAQFDILDMGMTLQPKWNDYRHDTHVNFTMPGVNYHVRKGAGFKKIPVVHWKPRAGVAGKVYRMLEPHMIRFRAEDCLDLPSKQFLRRDITMTKEQQKAYREMRDFLYTEFEGDGITARVAAVRMMKLREITGGFIITDDGKQVPLNEETPKMLELDLILDQVLGVKLGDEDKKPTKAIVWAQYQWECKELVRRYKRFNARGLFGGISHTKRDDAIEQFQNGGKCQLLICHPKSAGHGLTLTAANYAIYYSLSYDYDEFYQSARRIARPGQDRPMFFYFLIAPGTIDEIIARALEEKKKVSDVITDGPFSRSTFDSLVTMRDDQQLNINLEVE